MTTNMTPADWRRFAALLNLIRAGKGMGPSFNEIGAAWDIRSKGTITNYLNRIEAAGLIRRLPHRARAIEVASCLVPVMTQAGAVLLPVAGGAE